MMDNLEYDYDDKERQKYQYPTIKADTELCENQLRQLCKDHANPFLREDTLDWSIQFQSAFDELSHYRKSKKTAFEVGNITLAIREGRCLIWPDISPGTKLSWVWDGEIMSCRFIAWKSGSKDGKPTLYAEVQMEKDDHHMMDSPLRVLYGGNRNILDIGEFEKSWFVSEDHKDGAMQATEE